MVPTLGIFVFWQNFANRQIRECWFQIWQKVFKIIAQKHSKKKFLVLNLGIFIFLRNFEITQIWVCWFQIWQHHFQIPAQRYSNQTFSISNLSIFLFYIKLCIKKNSRTLISNVTIFFFKFQPKNIQIWYSWSQI